MNIKDELGMVALLVKQDYGNYSPANRTLTALTKELEDQDVKLVTVLSYEDACLIIKSDPSIQCVMLDWDLEQGKVHKDAEQVLMAVRARSETIPIFLLTERGSAAHIPVDALRKTDDFIFLLEDTASFITGRIVAAIKKYRENLLPPMFKALVKFAHVHEYSWHTPGHTGGTAFLKTPVGRAYFKYFGENLLRSDLSISVSDLGSLLDHSGPIGKGEQNAARVFGANRTYYVTNGSSTSNRVILMASVTRNQIALCDRNCHKSVEHAITMSGAIPVYLIPSRNQYGLIGPIPPHSLEPKVIKKDISQNMLAKKVKDKTPVHAVVTNSTYDGLCYNVKRVTELLGQSVDRLHFDEAWYGYARFNPIYKDRFAMYGEAKDYDKKGPTIFATQSTHKLLAALSQASMIHIRDGRKPIDHNRFNEAFMMHASTSPNYAIIASNDVSVAMMDGPQGRILTTDSIHEAVSFRQIVARVHAEAEKKKDWFFNVWQPDTVQDLKGNKIPFYKAERDYLEQTAKCWVLEPNAKWHGFGNIEKDYCMLDPIKVSITTPSVDDKGELLTRGIPAGIVTSYLATKGIIVEKTTDFTFLLLFSIGITKGKWGTLLNALFEFKRLYDEDTPLNNVLPDLVDTYPKRYSGLGLKKLADEMFAMMKKLKTTDCMSKAFSALPMPDYSPVEAYEHLVRNEVEKVTLEQMANRTAATGIVPYPPGIPLLMPGENAGAANDVFLKYLKSLEEFDKHFPGFEHDIHGIESEEGIYKLLAIKQ